MKPEGREIVKKLVAVSDVVIANLPYEDLQKMGIDYDTISAINPQDHPRHDLDLRLAKAPTPPASASTRSARRCPGAMFLSGDGKVPTRMNAPFVDFGTALLSTVGVLAALIDRAKSGKGQKVETALLRTAMNITNSHLIEQAMLSLNRIATLNRGFTAGPSDTFKCKDGWIYAMTIGQPLFVRWCKLMGDEGLVERSALQGRPCPRRQRRGAVGDHAEMVRQPRDRRGAGRAGGQPHSGRRRSIRRSRRWTTGMCRTPNSCIRMDFPGAAKPVPVLQEPVKLSRTPLTIRRRAPKLGEHTDQILRELGYEPAVIEKLRADRVV